MSEEIKDLQKQIRAVMQYNTLNSEQIAINIAEWMVREGYNKLRPLDEIDLADFIYKKRVNSDSITLAKYICFKFGKPEIKLPTSKLSPDDIKDGWDAGYVRGWEEYDEGLKRLNGLEAK